MLRLALLFLVTALVSALFGFGWVAGLEFALARVLVVLFLGLALVLVALHFVGSPSPPDLA